MASEYDMIQSLGDTFTPYVGRTQLPKPKKISKRELKKQFFASNKNRLIWKQKKLEEIAKKRYLKGQYAFKRVFDIVCTVHGVTEEEVLGPRRFAPLVRARRQIIYLLRQKRGLSWTELGKRMNRDHSTVMHHYYIHKADSSYVEVTKRLEKY